MDDNTYTLGYNGTLNTAKELTIKAIENGLITASTDPKETANSITDFYKQILKTINEA